MERLLTGGNFRRRSAGQGLPEYALILGLIAMFVIGALTLIGDGVDDVLTQVSNAI